MKKLLLALLLVVSISLVACSNNDDNEETDKQDNDTQTTEETQNNDQKDTEDNSKDNQNPADEDGITNEDGKEEDDMDQSSEESDLEKYEEYDILKEKIDDVDSHPYVVETDNPNTRVILFGEQKGEKDYKSVFVKEENRLKIIDLKKDDQIYNEIIK